jgi:diguanylate cyclase (GGDEF)-like protein/PAS domain S-box-containing protein
MSYLKGVLNKKVFLVFMLYALWVIGFAYISFIQEKQKLYDFLDQQLVDAAVTVPLLLPVGFHHKNMSENDLTAQEHYDNILKLSNYTDDKTIIYVYTLIMNNNKIFFTSSSATEKERESGVGLSFFFDQYHDVDPVVYQVFNNKEKTFLEYTDQWGTFRSVFIPRYAKDGTFYLTVADHSISYIQALLKQHVYRAIIVAILFLCFAYLVYWIATKRVKRIAKELTIKVHDQIAELKSSEERLQLFARIFNEAHEGITITDTQGIIIDVNPTFCKVTGFKREEVIGHSASLLNSGKHSPEFYQEMKESLRLHNHWRGEIWNRKKGGDIYAELLSISVLKDEKGKIKYYVGLFSDITESKKQQETLELMAHYYVLTQLPNRVLFADRFVHAAAHSKRSHTILAVCFLDIDNFKPVNDNYGHEAGDQLLIEFAERLKLNIREEDTVSRQGGDEFALLLGGLESFSQCEFMLERILESLSQPYIIDETPHKISVSIGLTLYPSDDADLDTLVRHADQAMYKAKLDGKNRYRLFNIDDDQQIILKHKQVQEVKQALSNDEFCLYYQPKVNMKTGVVQGVEALIRWNHPQQGMMLPLEFLPIIENTQLEIQMGEWVINEALTQLNSWKQQGIEFEISVNVSSYHLQADTFIAQLENTLARYPNVCSSKFQLEILETSVLDDLGAISRCIKSCRDKLGINIALDDFGTGYSSLTHLRNLSVNVIKIDRSFVRDMLDDPSDYAIIDGVIALSDSFNRQIIAEGVETTQHGLMLLVMGCHNVQGYGIARPMLAEVIPAWLNGYTPNKEWMVFGNKEHTSKQKQFKLFELTISQWVKRFEDNIQSSPEAIDYWPIMVASKCHCGSWINKAAQNQPFEQRWLTKLDKAHEEMHAVATGLLHKYQESEIEVARKGLGEFQKKYQKIASIIGQYEY